MGRDRVGHGLDEIHKRAEAAKQFYLRGGKRTWPLEKVERRDPSSYRRPNLIPARCAHCGEYPPRGSAAAGRCLACGIST